MLDWVATFIQRCRALNRKSISAPAEAATFVEHIRHMLPGKDALSQMLDNLSGAECAARLYVCQDYPAGRGGSA